MTPVRPALAHLCGALLATLVLAGGAHAQQSAQQRPPTTYVELQQLLKGGKADQALAQLDRRIADTPRDPQLLFLRAVALTDLGRTDDAIAALVELTQTYPELPEPYNNLAVLYAARSELDKAREALEMAVRARPDYAVAHENLGDIYARLAARSYERASALAPAVARSAAPKLAALRQLLATAAAR